MWYMLFYSLLIVVLSVCVIFDIKRREIPLVLLVILGGIVAFLWGYEVFWQGLGYMQFLGVIPGIFMLILARISEESVGYADGIVVAEIGLLTGVGRCLFILSAALFLAAIFSLFVLVIKKVSKKYKVPFIPFFTSAYAFSLLLQGGIGVGTI